LKERRSKLRILADILKVVEEEGGVGVTKIMCNANLPYDRLTRYLAELVEKGLLREESKGRGSVYYLTERGSEFLREYRKIEKFAEAFGIKL